MHDILKKWMKLPILKILLNYICNNWIYLIYCSVFWCNAMYIEHCNYMDGASVYYKYSIESDPQIKL